MPMIFIYFLHFKMKQMQPLLMQTVTGVVNLMYSPLWQVYVMGRNLERPFGRGRGGLEGLMGGNGGDGDSLVQGNGDNIAKEEEEDEEDGDEELEKEVDESASDEEEEESYDEESEESEKE